MRRTKADKHIDTLERMSETLLKLSSKIDYMGNFKLSDYRDDYEKDQARESNEYAENDVIESLWECSQKLQAIIKDIDPEALRELKEES